MATARKRRLDLLLVERGLCPSRETARRLVMAGKVRVDGRKVDRAARTFLPDVPIEIEEPPRFVGRGGRKLEHALETFGIPVRDLVALDVGASTGGFTDCLLQRGAARVYAVDVGHGQLHWKLRNDPRVICRERVNARNLDPSDFPEPVDLATIDVSFISLRLVLPAVAAVVRPGGRLVSLIKPQFEAGRSEIGKGGVVRDPEVHRRVVEEIRVFVEEEIRWKVLGETESPVRGPKGNREFLLAAEKPLA